MNTKADYSKLREIVSQCFSVAAVCSKLGLKPAGGNYKTVQQKIIDFGIDTNHFTGRGWSKGKKFPVCGRGASLEVLLVSNSRYQSHKLKGRLIRSGVKENRCEICGLNSWLENPLSLELDHVNGVNTDNRLCNLRILCPNCHSQTETFRARNKMSASLERARVESP